MRRTALVTAASVAAVVLTGTAAVGANIGILSSADDSPVGDLNATTELVTTPVEVVVEMPTAEPTPSPQPISPAATGPANVDAPGSSGRTEAFVVDRAGRVVVAVDGRALRAESVEPARGWTWIPDDDIADDTLEIRFRSGSEVLELEVELLDDGTLRAEIRRPQSASTPAPTSPVLGVDDDEHDDDHDEYEDDDHDEYEDDEHDDHHEDDEDEDDDRDEDDEHEGRDDDD